MKKYKDDGRVCESCIGYVSCLTWMQKELKAKRSSCNGWYYANKEQVEAMLEYFENKTKGKRTSMKKYDEDEEGCNSCMGNDNCFEWKWQLNGNSERSCGNEFYANKKQVEAMLEYYKNKETKDINFQVGDCVTSLSLGEGYISIIKDTTHKYPVSFKTCEGTHTFVFTKKGFRQGQPFMRDLYHGHDLNIEVDEKLPNRKVDKWVFLYTDDTGQEVNVSRHFVTETACEAGMYRATYVLDFTVLSKPIKIQVLAKGTL